MPMPEPLDVLYRIESEHFTAGLVVRRGVVSHATPIINWMVGRPLEAVTTYVAERKWKLERTAP